MLFYRVSGDFTNWSVMSKEMSFVTCSNKVEFGDTSYVLLLRILINVLILAMRLRNRTL